MKVVEVRQESQFRALKAVWETLLRPDASGAIFNSWEWAFAWWTAYGVPGDLRILLALDDDNVPRAIAPLRRETARRYGCKIPALSFIGGGSNDSDYLDFIIAPGFEEQAVEAFSGYWRAKFEEGVMLRLDEIPGTSPNLAPLRRLAESKGVLWSQSEVPCGAVRLPPGWDDYVSTLRPRFRTKVRSVLRNLESRSEARFGFARSPDELPRLLSAMFDLHTKRWAADGKPGVFRWDRKRDFYSAVSPMMLERGWLRFSWLEWNGSLLACQYGFAAAGVYYQLQEGYEPAAEHLNIGIGLRAWSIQQLLKEGVREYDFLGGLGRHKADWGAQAKHSWQLVLAPALPAAVLYSRGPAWEERVKEGVRRFVPEALLEARRTRLERQGAKSPQRSGHLRRAAAACYLNLRLPSLVRPVRQRFHLALASDGESRKVSWSRRTEGSARILFYHRINDDNDPFFPAMPTRLFEQQMRHLARQYTVVTISDLLRRVRNGSSESLLAVTFDDGYQDNFRNAFPILQRYGLPATIFLATESIDTRQPLWFEELAEALKRTARDRLDLEFDIPRRMWLRTAAERLASNEELFRLMRELPDWKRRDVLAACLRLLAVACEERLDKALTWDQIRAMDAAGIEFGGHTVTHAFLSRLTREQAVYEVSECKRRIESELQSPAGLFAYPNGREPDFSDWNKDVLRDAGYEAAVTTIWGLNSASTDPMELRRGGPWEETAALFAYKLDWYQLVNG